MWGKGFSEPVRAIRDDCLGGFARDPCTLGGDLEKPAFMLDQHAAAGSLARFGHRYRRATALAAFSIPTGKRACRPSVAGR